MTGERALDGAAPDEQVDLPARLHLKVEREREPGARWLRERAEGCSEGERGVDLGSGDVVDEELGLCLDFDRAVRIDEHADRRGEIRRGLREVGQAEHRGVLRGPGRLGPIEQVHRGGDADLPIGAQL